MSGSGSVSGAHTERRVRVELDGGDLTYRLALRGEAPGRLPLPQSDALVPYVAYDAEAEVGGVRLGRPVTLLMLPSEHTPSPHVPTGPFATNAHVERVWSEARRRLSGSGLTAFSSIDPAFAALGPSEAPLRHPPLTYCRKREVYFSPVCPSCLGPLETCRDDALLHRLYLTAYGESLVRYLYCPECAKSARPVTVYTYDLRDARSADGVNVRRRGELYRDLAPQIKGTQARAPGAHPCFACPHRETCYPAAHDPGTPIPAEEQLIAVAYYEFEFLPVEHLDLDFDAAARILGGGPLPAPAEGTAKESSTDSDAAFMFRGDGSGFFELEVLLLKLQAFGEIVDGVSALHEGGRRPHLGLSHSRIRARLDTLGPGRPAAWGLRLKMRDLVSAALPAGPVAGSESPEVWSPAYHTTPSYLPEGARSPAVERLWMTLRSAAVSPVDQGALSIDAQLTIDDLGVLQLGQHDVLQLELPVPGSAPVLAVGHGMAGADRLLRFEGELISTDTALVSRLQTDGIPPGRTGVTITRVQHAPVDVYALGILLLRLLFITDQDAAGVSAPDTVQDAAASIASARLAGQPAPDVPMLCRQAGLPASSVDILFRAADRDVAQGAVPHDLWSDVLALAVQLASNVPGFSVCGSADDYPGDDPGEPLREVSRQLDGLLRRTRVALLGTGGRNDLVLRALDDYLDDYKEALAGEEGETSTTGFKTVVGRRPK